MNKILSAMVLSTVLFSAVCSAQSIGSVEYTGRSEGTIVRTWLANTKTQWEPSSQYFKVNAGKPINWSGTFQVENVQTNYFQKEVVTQAAHRIWEKTGTTYTNEREPYCETLRQQDPPGQKRECPLVPVPHDVEGWVYYQEQTSTQDGGSERTVVQTQPIAVSVKVSGQVLRDYEDEELEVTVDENAQIEASVSNAKNKYDITAQKNSPQSASVVARGIGRNISDKDGASAEDVTFAQGGEPVVYQSSQDPNRIFVKFKVSAKTFDSALDPNVQLKVTYQIEQTDGLHASTTEYKKAGSRSVVIDPKSQQDFEIDLWGAGRGRSVRANLYFNVLGSRWYSERTFEAAAKSTIAR